MLNLMWYQIKVAREKPNRVVVYLYVATGRAVEVVKLLRDRGFWCRAHASNTIVFKDPASVVAFLKALDPSPALTAALDRYSISTSADAQKYGRSVGSRPADIYEEQVASAGQIAALMSD